MIEKEAVLTELKKVAKQYGLSVELLETISASAVLEDESALSIWIENQKPILAAIQRIVDAVRGSKRAII